MQFDHEDVSVDLGGLLASGIYFLLWRGEVMYVGQTKTMFIRLYAHCSGRKKRRMKLGGRMILGVVFDGIRMIPLPPSDLDRVEREMIEWYQPKYNDRMRSGPKLSIEDLMAAIKMSEAPAPSEPVSFIRRR